MTTDRLALLFSRYMSGSSNAAESREFLQLASLPENETELQELMDAYQRAGNHREGMDHDQRNNILKTIFEQEVLPGNSREPGSFVFSRAWFSYAAAGVLILLTAALLLYQRKAAAPKSAYTAYHGEVAPGTNKATLTLADGSTLSLTDAINGDLAHESGVKVSKTADGQLIYRIENQEQAAAGDLAYNSISTPAGGQYQVVLPDGTRVWLNATSKLKYPVSFASLKERRVELDGEAYFEVAKMKTKLPFIVSGKGHEVEVLGTHFNVNGYEDDGATITTLLEGSVKVKSTGVAERLLHPGQQARTADKIIVSEVDTNAVVAWKNGLFKFENASIHTVMRQFSRWYNVDVEYEGPVPQNKFTGEVYRNMDASKALKVLSFARIKFRMEAPLNGGSRKKIIISKN